MDELLLIDQAMEEDESDSVPEEVDFSDAVVWGTDWTTETIAIQIAKGNIDLNPSFQRRDAWSAKEKSKLIESLMLGVPVPPIVLAEDPKARNHYIVIDGKQRLLSIMQFYAAKDEIKNNHHETDYDVLTLTGLNILSQLNKLQYSEIPQSYLSNIDNGTIRTIAIKNWKAENFLYTVFLRLNTGSKKLSSQELRQALKPGPFLNYLDLESASSVQIKRMLNNKKPDKRMRDVELALRYFAFKYYIEDYDGNLKYFLDSTCERLNESWSMSEDIIRANFKELEIAIEFAFDLFGERPFCRYSNGTTTKYFNRCIFELFSYYFSISVVRERIEKHRKKFIDGFKILNNDQEFVSFLEGYPKMREKVVGRFNKFSELIISLDDDPIDIIKKFRVGSSGIEVE